MAGEFRTQGVSAWAFAVVQLQVAYAQERHQSGSALFVASAIGQGVLVAGSAAQGNLPTGAAREEPAKERAKVTAEAMEKVTVRATSASAEEKTYGGAISL